MAIDSEVFTLGTAWGVGAVYEATVAVDIVISAASDGARSQDDVKYLITSNDTPPTEAVRFGHPIKKHEITSMQLLAGEHIWFAKTCHEHLPRSVTLTWAD